MTKSSKTIVFFGNERLATGVSTDAPTLRRLIDGGYSVAAVVANHEESRSRSRRELEIALVAREYDIPVLLPRRLGDIAEQLAAIRAEIGVLVAYGRIVPQHIIDLFPKGIVNIHPSLLPLHRGPTPLESVILEGATHTGVSLMQLVKAMDAGPIYAQQQIALDGTETKQILADTLLALGGDMLVASLDKIIDGSLTPFPQDDSLATYDALIQKSDGIIDWNKTATTIEREVRAYASWPKSRTTIGGLDITVTGSHAATTSGASGKISIIDKKPAIFCGVGALVIDRLVPAGKKEMSGEGFLAGYKHLFPKASY